MLSWFLTVYARRPQVDKGCTDLWCDVLQLLDPLILLLWTGVVTVIALATITYVRRAQAECDSERERTRAERMAFAAFADRVREMEPSLAAASDGLPGDTLVQANAPDRRLQRVQDAYRETVMAVPHYEDEFGEPLELNMTAELGPEVAPAVIDGSGFTPQLQGALVAKSEDAFRQRRVLENRIDREEAFLGDAEETFESVQRRLERLNETPLSQQSFEDLERTYRRLSALEGECSAVVEERQDAVRKEINDGGEEGPANFYHYLYRPLEVSYPVLADGSRVLDLVETAKRNVRLALTRRA